MLKWLQEHLLPCAYKAVFGIDCPMCGFQRSFVLLLEGKWADSFRMYPPLIPVLLLCAFLVAALFSRRKIQAGYLYGFSAVVLCIVMINYGINLFILH